MDVGSFRLPGTHRRLGGLRDKILAGHPDFLAKVLI